MRHLSACFLLVLAVLLLQQTPAAAQIISVDPLTFDFGEMKQQQTRTATVTVTNEGAALLRILKVNAECGCTVPKLAKESLAPGESTQIEIQFSSKKFNGKVMKVVNIMSNDPNNPQVDIIFTADVHTVLVIDPTRQQISFHRSLQGEVLTDHVTFTAVDVPKLEISADKTRHGLFHINTVNGYEGDPKVSILEVTIPADMEPGRHRDYVRVNTNIEEMPTVDIEMKAWVSQTLVATPEQISFRYKKNFRQTIQVSPFEKGTEFKITGADIDLPEISVEVMETIPNVETKIILNGAPISSSDPRAQELKGHIKGTLTIHTDQPETPFIKIPVTYMVRL